MLKTIRTLAGAGWHLLWNRRAKRPTADARGLERSAEKAEFAQARDRESREQASSSLRVEDLSDYQGLIGVL